MARISPSSSSPLSLLLLTLLISLTLLPSPTSASPLLGGLGSSSSSDEGSSSSSISEAGAESTGTGSGADNTASSSRSTVYVTSTSTTFSTSGGAGGAEPTGNPTMNGGGALGGLSDTLSSAIAGSGLSSSSSDDDEDEDAIAGGAGAGGIGQRSSAQLSTVYSTSMMTSSSEGTIITSLASVSVSVLTISAPAVTGAAGINPNPIAGMGLGADGLITTHLTTLGLGATNSLGAAGVPNRLPTTAGSPTRFTTSTVTAVALQPKTSNKSGSGSSPISQDIIDPDNDLNGPITDLASKLIASTDKCEAACRGFKTAYYGACGIGSDGVGSNIDSSSSSNSTSTLPGVGTILNPSSSSSSGSARQQTPAEMQKACLCSRMADAQQCAECGNSAAGILVYDKMLTVCKNDELAEVASTKDVTITGSFGVSRAKATGSASSNESDSGSSLISGEQADEICSRNGTEETYSTCMEAVGQANLIATSDGLLSNSSSAADTAFCQDKTTMRTNPCWSAICEGKMDVTCMKSGSDSGALGGSTLWKWRESGWTVVLAVSVVVATALIG